MQYWIWSIRPEHYPAFVRTGTFAVRRVGRKAVQAVRPGDRIVAYLSGRRVVAGLFEATGAAFEDATAIVPGGAYRHRVRVRPLATLNEEVWVGYDAFAGKLAVLDEYAGFGEPDKQFRAVVQRVVHPLPPVDGKVLEFLIRAREGTDAEAVMAAYERLRQHGDEDRPPVLREPQAAYRAPSLDGWDRAAALERLTETVEARGFVYQPWQVAAYVTALRTKPFVLLAGVTGVGKSRLPVLVAEATGGAAHLLPVRPDWTDSAEVLGYTDLQGTFRPGALLTAARRAADAPERYAVAVLDEMNLARPEHYLAEVLSRIEGRRPADGGGFESAPLVPARPERLPPNLGLVGTVNMDESAFGFSRKVLDRAFTLELSDVDLGTWHAASADGGESGPWPVAAWWPRAATLGGLSELGEAEAAAVNRVVRLLTEADALLAPAGLGIGYRLRDEAALFVLHAAETPAAFRTRDGVPLDPLDLALFMKLLPRIAGGNRSVRRALLALLGWAAEGTAYRSEDDARDAVATWEQRGRPSALAEARFPRTAGRLALMTDRLLADGFASFWE